MQVKKYEGLFILNTSGKEEGIKEIIDQVTAEITNAGGKVETVQKMDRRTFARVARKKLNAGFYANIIFEGQPALLADLRAKFSMHPDVFRVLFTRAPKEIKTGALTPASA